MKIKGWMREPRPRPRQCQAVCFFVPVSFISFRGHVWSGRMRTHVTQRRGRGRPTVYHDGFGYFGCLNRLGCLDRMSRCSRLRCFGRLNCMSCISRLNCLNRMSCFTRFNYQKERRETPHRSSDKTIRIQAKIDQFGDRLDCG